jgi:hypothetical protein
MKTPTGIRCGPPAGNRDLKPGPQTEGFVPYPLSQLTAIEPFRVLSPVESSCLAGPGPQDSPRCTVTVPSHAQPLSRWPALLQVDDLWDSNTQMHDADILIITFQNK